MSAKKARSLEKKTTNYILFDKSMGLVYHKFKLNTGVHIGS